MDLLHALFAVGCEPSPKELFPVLAEIQSNLIASVVVDTELAELLSKFKIDPPRLSTKLAYWKEHGYCERPAGCSFEPWSSSALYNPFALGLNKLVPHIIGLLMALVPIVFSEATGSRKTVLGGDQPGLDGAVDVILTATLWILSSAAVLVIFDAATRDRIAVNALTKQVIATAKSGRLVLVAEIESLRALYRFVETLSSATMRFHVAAMEATCILVVIAAALVFATSLLNTQLESWSFFSCVAGLLAVHPLGRSLLGACEHHKLKTAGILDVLQEQRRWNMDELKTLKFKKPGSARENLIDAIDSLDSFVEEIKIKRPTIMFGFVPLTKANVVKLGGAVMAAFFSTLGRAAIK
ncbi:hypothetical protein TeGR_g8456 [Tetraparma gracilis]|uniref:Uncharacterized protein n=1 Tax=Tetraparma gracilis TaxID=2962635 RepID=A0ABQ6MVJ6_9STRA|nr:hypothetical protein TeGR_g8456 [Tetraparma gracilis]